MATYKEIQKFVKSETKFVPKTYWISDAKEKAGLKVRRAPNRKSNKRMNPCPPEKLDAIMFAFKHFNMIK
jgi:hypothetical protein